VAEIDAADHEERIQCGFTGHQKSDCNPDKSNWLPPRCNYCHERGHFQSECPDMPEAEKQALPQLLTKEGNGRTCRRCNSDTHLANETTSCKTCHSCGHAGNTNCLNKCKICKEEGTHKTQFCPKKLPCAKCCGNRSTRHCTVKPEDHLLFSERQVNDFVNNSNIANVSDANDHVQESPRE
jgi:hypothetical protein